MTQAEWRKTPYATSEAKDPDKSIRDLLDRRGIVDQQFTRTTGPAGRPLYAVMFKLKDTMYRVGLEVLNARGVDQDQLMRQVKRAIFYMLKSAIEYTSVFGSMEQIMFAFIVDPKTNATIYETMAPHLPKLTTGGVASLLPALPPHQEIGS
jgi:hypothetical protein